MAMNKFGQMAQRHWRQARPVSYGRIPESQREEFFTTLGQEAAQEVENRVIALAGQDPSGETAKEKQQRLNMARLTAEEAVLQEMILLPEEASAFEDSVSWEEVEQANQPPDTMAEWMAQEDPEGQGPQDPQAWMEWYSNRDR